RRAAPWRTSPTDPRPPASRASASTRIDFPAPVSPVMTVSPSASSSSRSSTIARFLTVSRRSTEQVYRQGRPASRLALDALLRDQLGGDSADGPARLDPLRRHPPPAGDRRRGDLPPPPD